MILDAYAVIAHLADEPAAGEVRILLRDAKRPRRITAIGTAEVVDKIARATGARPSDVRDALELLAVDGLETFDVDADLACAAGELRARHYHRVRCPVSLADCFALAAAVSLGEELATSDGPLAEAARAEGVQVIALPDSTGQRP